jgi:hypothetical protein
MTTERQVYRFRIQLADVTPPIWRRIEVPDSYTFWDLHVAVQDAMGWLDYHLHEFQLRDPRNGDEVLVGLPDEEGWDDRDIMPDWEAKIVDYFTLENRNARYLYDFGDDWVHTLELETIQPSERGETYPRCVDGSRACPPEDCGGVGGYEDICAGEDEELREYYPDFDPDEFDAHAVTFDNPRERWKIAFG